MPAPKRPALTVLYTGNGKGKTTAALGILLRAWGRGMKVCMLSFIKSETSNYGEERAARKLGIELIPLGAGFTWLSKDIEHDKALGRAMMGVLKDDTQLFKMFSDDPGFKRWLSDMVFRMTYDRDRTIPPSSR